MDTDNQLAKTTIQDSILSGYDAHCKRFLSIKIILAFILKGCLDEYKDYEPEIIAENFIEGEPKVSTESVHQDEPEMIKGMNTESSAEKESVVRYDILFYAVVPASNEMIKLIINIEAQSKFYPGYPLLKRAFYYCSRLISSQYNTEFTDKSYADVKKVVSIWICNNAPKNKQDSITRFSVKEENLVGNAKYKLKDYDLMEVVMVCMGDMDDYKKTQGLIKLLTMNLSSNVPPEEKKSVMENEYGIKMSKRIEREVLGMCNLSLGILEKGMEKGMEKGKIEGITAARLDAITNVMKNFNVSLEQALKALNIPESECPQYTKLILDKE